MHIYRRTGSYNATLVERHGFQEKTGVLRIPGGILTLFTPLRVGWPPTPQVYFGPWEGLRVVSPVGAPQAKNFHFPPPWGLPKLGNFHFSPPWGLPKLGNFHFSPPWGLPKLGNFHFSPPWGLPKLGNFHFSPPWGHGIFTFPSLGGSPSCGISNS